MKHNIVNQAHNLALVARILTGQWYIPFLINLMTSARRVAMVVCRQNLDKLIVVAKLWEENL